MICGDGVGGAKKMYKGLLCHAEKNGLSKCKALFIYACLLLSFHVSVAVVCLQCSRVDVAIVYSHLYFTANCLVSKSCTSQKTLSRLLNCNTVTSRILRSAIL